VSRDRIAANSRPRELSSTGFSDLTFASALRIDGKVLRWSQVCEPFLVDALHDMSQQLRAAPDTKMAIESGHVLVDRCLAQTETSGDLLFAVPFEQARERLPESPGQTLRPRLGRADERMADQAPQVYVEETQQLLLARGELPLSEILEERIALATTGEPVTWIVRAVPDSLSVVNTEPCGPAPSAPRTNGATTAAQTAVKVTPIAIRRRDVRVFIDPPDTARGCHAFLCCHWKGGA